MDDVLELMDELFDAAADRWTAGAGASILAGEYDLIYDSGCLHHLPPHRRVSYLQLLDRMLAPGGHFALACFAGGAIGSQVPDRELYQAGGLGGGLAFTPELLRWIFADFEEIEIRPMRQEAPDSTSFGLAFLVTGLFRRPPH